jgi:hypothetical protein
VGAGQALDIGVPRARAPSQSMAPVFPGRPFSRPAAFPCPGRNRISAHPVLRTCRMRACSQALRAPGAFGRRVSRKARREARKRRGGSGGRSGGSSFALEPEQRAPLPAAGGDLSCPEREEPGTSGGGLEPRLCRQSSLTVRRWAVFQRVRLMNRLRGTVEVAARLFARGLGRGPCD